MKKLLTAAVLAIIALSSIFGTALARHDNYVLAHHWIGNGRCEEKVIDASAVGNGEWFLGPCPAPTATKEPTQTVTPTPPTATAIPSGTPVPTDTTVPTNVPTDVPTDTPTAEPSETPTDTPTAPVPTGTIVPTDTVTPTPTVEVPPTPNGCPEGTVFNPETGNCRGKAIKNPGMGCSAIWAWYNRVVYKDSPSRMLNNHVWCRDSWYQGIYWDSQK